MPTKVAFAEIFGVGRQETTRCARALAAQTATWAADLAVTPSVIDAWAPAVSAFVPWIAERRGRLARPLIVGVGGAQGTGKSTMTALVGRLLSAVYDLGVASLCIDDLYRTRADRQRLATEIHPLLATRGVPGTHDVALAHRILDGLSSNDEVVVVPRFDKLADDRRPLEEGSQHRPPRDVVLFEGWCIAAEAETAAAIVAPINDLELKEDPTGLWRRYVNARLDGEYRDLFARIDVLTFLAAPDMRSVVAWRREQEASLALQARRPALLEGEALERFVAHFERITRSMLETVPARADVVMRLDTLHRVTNVLVTR